MEKKSPPKCPYCGSTNIHEYFPKGWVCKNCDRVFQEPKRDLNDRLL